MTRLDRVPHDRATARGVLRARRARLAPGAGAVLLAGGVMSSTLALAPADASTDWRTVVHESFASGSAAGRFTPAGPARWTVGSGSYTATARTAAARPSTSVSRTRVDGTTWRLTTVARILTTSSRGAVGVVLDYSSATSYRYVVVANRRSDSGVFAVRAGVTTRLAALHGLPAGRRFALELRRTPGQVKVFAAVPGRTPAYVGKAELPDRTGTRLGFLAGRAGSVRVDDLTVVVPVVTAPPPVTATPPAPSSPTPTAPSPTVPSPTAPGPTTPPPTEPVPTTVEPPTGGRAVAVSTSSGLTAALADARPGDVISLAPGTYTTKGTPAPTAVGTKTYVGTFVASTPGTSDRPIVLRGPRTAVIDGKPGGDGLGTQYGLYLAGADHWVVQGITVTNVAKGIVLDRTSHAVLEDLEVARTGQEGIHLRAGSSDDVVRDNTVHDTGLNTATYGEGIYVGSAGSNWGTYTDGSPDRSDRNQLLGNTIYRTGAESIDIKEGTTGGLIQHNTFDGTGMTGSWADSWVDLKGNDWQVLDNSGVNALQDGFQVHGALPGWGNGNVFRRNTLTVNAAGYGVWTQNNVAGTVVGCDNTVTAAGSGRATIPCT